MSEIVGTAVSTSCDRNWIICDTVLVAQPPWTLLIQTADGCAASADADAAAGRSAVHEYRRGMLASGGAGALSPPNFGEGFFGELDQPWLLRFDEFGLCAQQGLFRLRQPRATRKDCA